MSLPIDSKLIYQLSTHVIDGKAFDLIFKSSDSPKEFQTTQWHGSVWADLTAYVPFQTLKRSPAGQDLSPSLLFEYSIERALQIIFTHFATRQFEEGLFVIRAEMGQYWFTPILQQPHCILRHMNSFPFLEETVVHTNSTLDRNNNDISVLPSPDIFQDASHKNMAQMSPRKRANTISTSHPSHFETCAVFYLGQNVKNFCSAFYSVGFIPGINCW
jgi:hypothetical protein